MMSQPGVVIVGGGLAGLACGLRLAQVSCPFTIVEASDGVGGRVRTDRVGGFQLDRGFQIHLTAYPEAARVLDHAALDLKRFYRGALVRYAGHFYRLADPSRHPLGACGTLARPLAGYGELWNVLPLVGKVRTGTVGDQWRTPERLTLDLLRDEAKLSDRVIDRFFRPFFGGVFLDRQLKTSSRLFRFVLRMFACGEAVVPASGIEAIPRQLADKLPAGSVRLNTAVEALSAGGVRLAGGEALPARAVVVATEGPAAARLLDDREVPEPGSKGQTCLYFAAAERPVGEPTLVLDGDGTGPVNNLVEISTAAPGYAPPGQCLISCAVVGIPAEDDAALESAARRQLVGWFGAAVNSWRLLRVYRIAHAQPDQTAPALEVPQRPVRLRPGLYVCGDHRDNASIDGALTSGRRAAEALLEDLDMRKV